LENEAKKKLPPVREMFKMKDMAILANKLRVDRAKRKACPDALVIHQHALEKIDRVFDRHKWERGDETVAILRQMTAHRTLMKWGWWKRRELKKMFCQAEQILLAQGFDVKVEEGGNSGIGRTISLIYHHRPHI